MSGAVAAHAAYNGAGTQGLAVTNKINDTGDIVSVFWNKNDTTRQLLHGANYVEVPSQGTSGGSTRNIINFDINNDVDCIGDLVLEINATIGTGTAANEGFDLLKALSRVELVVGTQVWQTLEYEDLLALYHSEVPPGCFDQLAYQLSGHYTSTTEGVPSFLNELGTTTATTYTVATIPLKMLTKTLASELEVYSEHTEDGHLMAAAPNQLVRINVHTREATAVDPLCSKISVKLYSKNIVMCEAERQQLVSTRLAKRIKVTQNAIYRPSSNSDITHTINLDHFSLYASHLVIITSIPYYRLDTVELLLNSSSFSGEVPVEILKITGGCMGLYSNTSGHSVGADDMVYLTFPLASTAYGGASVPLNRFDNIRLIVKGISSGLNAPRDTSVGNTTHIISVTAVGCTTALYANGVASISMY
jgi:hypothetical protein